LKLGSEAMYADLGHFSQSSIKVCNVFYNTIILQDCLCTKFMNSELEQKNMYTGYCTVFRTPGNI
jgi:K+ transporter